MKNSIYMIFLIGLAFLSISCEKDSMNPSRRFSPLIYPSSNEGVYVIMDSFEGIDLIIAGSIKDNFVVSFYNNLNGSKIFAKAVGNSLPAIFSDSLGNEYDVRGKIVKGPMQGQSLKSTNSFMGFWFAWGSFFKGAEIYNDSRSASFEERIYLAGSWLIPSGEVFSGGPPKDGIPALANPQLSADSGSYLDPKDLVLGLTIGNEARAYPHRILDWHEIINDQIGNTNLVITYCPLTGTGIGWMQENQGISSSFGVSGLLYNSNLLPYDRTTDSYWSQIRQECVFGERKGEKIHPIQLIETTWETWQTMFPDTRVISTNTGYDRNYSKYPYGSYKSEEGIFFPVSKLDNRLHPKEIVHGIVINNKARIYRFKDFE